MTGTTVQEGDEVDVVEPLELTSLRDPADSGPARSRARAGVPALLLAIGAIGVAVWAVVLDSHATVAPGRTELAVVVSAWAIVAIVALRQRPDEPIGSLIAAGAMAGAIALLGAAMLGRDGLLDSTRDVGSATRAFALVAAFGIALHLTLGLPDGRLVSTARRVSAAVGYVVALAAGVVLYADRPEFPAGPLVALGAFAAVVGVVGFVARCQRAGVTERPRLQWCVWGALVATAVVAVTVVLHALVDWPDRVLATCVVGTLAVPLAVGFSVLRRRPVRVDRLLVHTIVLVGLVALVAVVYLVVLLGLGRRPEGDEQTLLGLSLLAAAIAALAWVPARERLTELATRRVYGERHAPDEVLRTFGSRLTRALPLDELLLQLAESLKKTMSLDVAEVWTRTAGRLERAVSVPDRGSARLDLGPEEEVVVARAGVSGPAWARVWMPALVASADPVMRIAPVTNSGELLGLIVVRRPDGGIPFDEDDDQALTELARQVGLALHNVKLDSALQESLDEVRRQADELRASRARIVEATDAERRRIERDLHDGAQQHLVALAVSVRLARQIADADPDAAMEMLDQIGVDLQDAVQELRNLAHGIYPPLLMDRGLGEALRAAGNRAVLPTDVVVDDGVGRYPQAVEAAVYFCCLEALQNAGKHAGEGSSITVTLAEDEGALLFEVADDGAGFDMGSGAQRGHGFVNMADRVGAFGGTVRVESTPGVGTTIAGRVPLPT